MDWITTFEALKAVYIDGAYSNMAINEALEHHSDCSGAFVRTFVKGVIRETILLDSVIDSLAEKGIAKIKNRTLIVIRMGLYAIRELDSVPDYAAVNEAVKLSRKVAIGTDRFVNAILRNYIRKSNEYKDNTFDLATRYSFPEKLVELISDQYGRETEKILAALNEPAAFVIRTNALKTTRSDLIDILRTCGIDAEIIKETKNGVICKGGNVLATDAYRDGLFTVQSLSSILAIEALDLKKGYRVLDMCAAPGGKTTAIAEAIGDDGEIIACDVYEHRLSLIEATAKRLGITSVKTGILDGTEHCAEMDESFDFVLADVPCSGLGVIPSKPEIKITTDPDKYAELEEIQYKILENAIRYTKDGGIIEYSTCTINKSENETVVNRIINSYGFVHILEKTQILPYNNKVGFFYCIMQKKS